MKKYLKNYLTGIFVWLGFLSILFLGYLAIKARQATNPWIADDGQGMYATNGTTLSASKWNTLVQRSTWVDVDINDTTSDFDPSCDRRLKSIWWDGCAEVGNYWNMEYNKIWSLWIARSNWQRYIDKSNKKYLVYYDNPAGKCAILKLQKRCP